MIQGVGPIEDDAEYLDRFPGILAQSKFLRKVNNLNFYLYPCFHQNGSENYKTIMFIGVTGSGKTSSINFFLNYYLGVKFEDNIRFQLIDEQLQGGSQYFSQTQNVNIYYVQPINGNDGLRIIDTPGFANERGILQDQIILDRIQNCFSKDIDQISAVCFLIKATDTSLTITQQYVFTQITKIFGKDIIKNLIFLFPFCDFAEDEEPSALQMVKFKGYFEEKKSILADIYDQMSEPKHIKYNNSLMQQKNTSYGKQEYWNYYMNQFNVFKEEKIEKVLPVSLSLTQTVIIQREQNLKMIKQLKTFINDCFSKITYMKETYKAISEMEPQILASSNFTSTKTVWNTITVEHRDEFKRTFIEYSRPQQQKNFSKSFASSKILTKKTQQTKQLTKVVYETKISKHQQQQCNQEITTNYEMRAQHDQLQTEKMNKEKLLENIINDYYLNVVEYEKLTYEFFERRNRLKKIALNPQLTYEFESEYIQILLRCHYNDKEKQILNEMLADFKMHDELQVIKNGDQKKLEDFRQQLFQARREGNLKGLLLNQP